MSEETLPHDEILLEVNTRCQSHCFLIMLMDGEEEEEGQLHPDDKCVANCMVKGSQQTICFYMGNNKILHVDQSIVIQKLEE